jgi:hypothetical protein
MNDQTILDTFEAELLSDLRSHVATRPRAPRLPRLKVAMAGGVAALGALGAVVVMEGGSPAFAVATQSDGDIVVTVSRLDDAAGLQQALRAEGIDAAVTFRGADPAYLFDPRALPDGQARYSMSDCTTAYGPSLQRTGDGFIVTIPRADIGTAENLTLVTDGDKVEDATISVAYGNRSSGCLTSSVSEGIGTQVNWGPQLTRS